MVVRPDGQVDAPGKIATQLDQSLLVALTQAFYWQQLLDDGVVGRGSEIARREANELLRLPIVGIYFLARLIPVNRPPIRSGLISGERGM